MNDKDYMALAIQLAKATKGQTSPNPSVGAVIVKHNQIIGMGSHLLAGLEHAEIHALNTAGKNAEGATLYVTLEPCAHFGKTPPCAAAIIKARIAKVVIATLDLNPQVRAKGVKQLQDAGIQVEVGLLEAEAIQINQEFFYSIQHKMPYISLKAGLSLDCKLATKSGESKWITNEQARLDVHHYRHTHDAILVGVGSVIADDPALTTRLPGGGKNPIRIVLDTHLRTPLGSQLVNDNQAPTWIITGSDIAQERALAFASLEQVTIVKMPDKSINLQELMLELFRRGITSILVEGGNQIHSSFLECRLINRLIMYISPMLIGGKDAPTLFAGSGFAHLADSLRLKFEQVRYLGDNIKIIANVEDILCLPE